MFKEFKNNRILLAYYGGSIAYKTTTSTSDIDIIVVLDDFRGCGHIVNTEKGIEYYVFGKDYFIRRMEYDEDVTPYLKVFNDDITVPIDPIILDESFKETYLKYKNRDFSKFMDKYLDAVINYFEVFLNDGSLKKNLYHLYRIEEQINRYLDTGAFMIDISEEILEKIIVFKENYQSNSIHFIKELQNILNYLKGVREDVFN